MGIELAGFIAATSVVTGTLVVWAQLWGNTARDYASRNEPTSTAEVGLSVAYLGALASLFALIITMVSLMKGDQAIPHSALWLFGFALLITFLEILQSLVSVTLRLRGERILGPTSFFEKALRPKCVRVLSMVLIFLIAAGILGVSIYVIRNLIANSF